MQDNVAILHNINNVRSTKNHQCNSVRDHLSVCHNSFVSFYVALRARN